MVKKIDFLQRDLYYFIEVAQVLNISKAAERLGLQQPALSRSIQRLESDIGQKLFIRKNLGLLLTATGQTLLKSILETERNWNDSLGQVFQNEKEIFGEVNFAFHPSFGQNYLTQIVQYFSDHQPQVHFKLQTMSSFQVIRKIIDQEIDFGIVVSRFKNPELVSRKIGEDYLASYQANTQTTSKALLISPEMQSLAFITKKFQKNKKIFIPDYDLIAKTLLKGPYSGILPHSVAQNYRALKQVSGIYQKADLVLVAHKERLRSISFKLAFEQLTKICSEV